MSDRSFVRFGGLAAILLALTSWCALAAYFTLGHEGQDEVGMEMFELLAALVGFWALFGVVALHWTIRAHGEAWSFFATLIGVGASLAIISAALYPIAFTRAVLARPVDPGTPFPVAIAATDPLNVMSLGLTGLWFVIVALLLWRAGYARRLAVLGFAVAALLIVDLLGTLGAQASGVTPAVIVAGAVVAPLFWLWLGVLLRRSRGDA